MAGKEAEVIAEYNAFLLQNGRGDYNVTTVLFDDQYVLLYYCLPIGYAQLYPEQYYVRGACALYDAIGRTITTVNACHAQLTESKRPKTYLFIRTNAAKVWMGDIFRWLRCTDGVGGGTHTQRHQRCGGQPG